MRQEPSQCAVKQSQMAEAFSVVARTRIGSGKLFGNEEAVCDLSSVEKFYPMARKATQKSGKNHSRKQNEKRAVQHGGHRPLDQVKASVNKSQAIANIEDMPSGGKFACKKCDLYFRDEHTLSIHNKTKAHKKRAKEWSDKCHDTKDAERAAGLL